MKLEAYLAENDMSPSGFAQKIGMPASTIWRILKGSRAPRLVTVALIERATNGRVTASDFIVPSEERIAS